MAGAAVAGAAVAGAGKAGAGLTGAAVAGAALAGAMVAAAGGPPPRPLGAAASMGAAAPKESCPIRLVPNVKTNNSMATADAQEKTGTSRGTGARIPAILGVKVKLRGARRWGVRWSNVCV
jgi:hypothetical protein